MTYVKNNKPFVNNETLMNLKNSPSKSDLFHYFKDKMIFEPFLYHQNA